MRKLLIMLGILAGAPVLITSLLFLSTLSFYIVIGMLPPCIAPTGYHMTRMHMIAWRGEMGWSGDIEQAVEHQQQCGIDKRYLAERLLSDADGTIVSLGMDLVVRESFDDGDRLLMQYRDDKRWNHNLTLNDEYSRLLLAMWRMKKHIPLSEEDRAVITRWPDAYFEGLGVVPPVRKAE